jgi:hypothetical protein
MTQLSLPKNKYYIFKNLDLDSYQKKAKIYSLVKKFGFNGLYVWLTGQGLIKIAVEVSCGSVRK